MQELKIKITSAVRNFDDNTLKTIFKSMENRLCVALREEEPLLEHQIT